MKYNILSKPKNIYENMLLDIQEAKKEILLETYIYDKDKIGKDFRDALVSKALEGVRVRLLLDSIISNVNKKFFEKLIDAGGKVRFSRKFRYSFRIFNDNHERNHRKLLLIDGKISYIGSINITNSCIEWRELVLRINGSLSTSLRIAFNNSWNKFNKFNIKRIKKIIHKKFVIIQDFPRTKHCATEKSYKKLIENAKREILIETPYFIPSIRIRRAFRKALKKGVIIRIILPRYSDVKIVDIVRNRYLGALHRMGVKMYYYPKILHSKLLIIDDNFFLLGSSNLDYRSFRHQCEINLLGKDKAMIVSLKKHFNGGLRVSRRFNYKSWKNRHRVGKVLEKFLELFRKYL